MGRTEQILWQVFSIILSNRKRFNPWDSISSQPLFAFCALGQWGFQRACLEQMESSKVLTKVRSAASCGNVLPRGARQSVHLYPACLTVQLKHPLCLVKKWKKGLSKQMVCNGKLRTTVVIGE